MRILQIFPGKVWGGAEQFVLNLGLALRDKGHEVEFLVRRSDAVIARLENAVEFSVVGLGGGVFPFGKPDPVLVEAVRNADIVHVHDISHVDAVFRAVDIAGSHAKVILTRHIARASRTLPWRRGSLKRLHRILFVSHLGRRLWQSVNSWMPAEKCMVVHNSIPPYAGAEAEDLRQRYAVRPGVPLILFTGRVRESKGCQVLVEALVRVRDLDWTMIFVGTCKPADFDKELVRIAQRGAVGHRVGFYGFSDNVRALIRQADIGVAPSIVREACPLSPMEFMQAAVPVIATDNGAQPEYITDGETGVLVPPDNVEALAAALRSMITDPRRRQRIGRRGAGYFAENLSYQRFIDEILRAYS